MAQITQFSLPDGGTVYVEAADRLHTSGEQRAAIETIGKFLSGDKTAGAAAPDLAERMAPILKALKVVQDKVIEVGNPQKVEIEAGIKFTGEAGVVLSKYGAEASISVKLTWERREKGSSTSSS